MKRLLFIALLVFANSSAFASFVVVGDANATRSSSASQACQIKATMGKTPLEFELKVSGDPQVGLNIICITYGTIGGYPVRNRYTVSFEGCGSDSTLNSEGTACIPKSSTEVCEKHKGAVLYDQRASFCMSNGKLKFYIQQCEVVNSAGGVIIVPPESNPSLGYLGDWVITGLPKSSCTPEGEKPEEPSDPEKPEENKCPEGSTWSGTTCIPNSSGEGEGEGEGGEGGSGGGSSGGEGGSGGGSGGGGSGGSGGGSGGNNPIGGDGDGEGGSGGGGTGTGEGGNGNGNGDGDGGNCDPSVEECGDGDGKSSVSGMPCDAPIMCKGDAVACAILEQQKEAWCKSQQYHDNSDKVVNKEMANVRSGLSGEEYEKPKLGEGDKRDLTGIFNNISGGGGYCPVLPEIIYSIGGHSDNVRIPMEDLCKWLGFFGSLMVAFSLYRGAGIVAGGMN